MYTEAALERPPADDTQDSYNLDDLPVDWRAGCGQSGVGGMAPVAASKSSFVFFLPNAFNSDTPPRSQQTTMTKLNTADALDRQRGDATEQTQAAWKEALATLHLDLAEAWSAEAWTDDAASAGVLQ